MAVSASTQTIFATSHLRMEVDKARSYVTGEVMQHFVTSHPELLRLVTNKYNLGRCLTDCYFFVYNPAKAIPLRRLYIGRFSADWDEVILPTKAILNHHWVWGEGIRVGVMKSYNPLATKHCNPRDTATMQQLKDFLRPTTTTTPKQSLIVQLLGQLAALDVQFCIIIFLQFCIIAQLWGRESP